MSVENRVGHNAPAQAVQDTLLKQAKDVNQQLDPWCITLTPEERQARPKPLRGAEARIRKVYDLCQRYGVTLRKVSADEMMNDLNLFVGMAPLVSTLRAGAQKAEDTQDQAFSEAWAGFLALYGALAAAAEHDPELEGEMADLYDFMSIYAGNKNKKGAAAPEAAKAATTAAGTTTPAATPATTPATTPASGSTTTTTTTSGKSP